MEINNSEKIFVVGCCTNVDQERKFHVGKNLNYE